MIVRVFLVLIESWMYVAGRASLIAGVGRVGRMSGRESLVAGVDRVGSVSGRVSLAAGVGRRRSWYMIEVTVG